MGTVSDWRYSDRHHCYCSQVHPYVAIAKDIKTSDMLKEFQLSLGVATAQVVFAAIGLYQDEVRALNRGRLPDYRDCPVLSIKMSRLLNYMGRKPQGKNGGYSRAEQLDVKKRFQVATTLSFRAIEQPKKSKSGGNSSIEETLLSIKTSSGISWTFGSQEDMDLLEVRFKPGKSLWDLLRRGKYWFPLRLLSYHPVREKYSYCIGYYLCCLLLVRRDKVDQRKVILLSIDQKAGIKDLDTNNSRRIRKIEEAICKLARDGIIGCSKDSEGNTELLISTETGRERRVSSRMRKRSLILIPPRPAKQKSKPKGKW